jgi:hypothetical protein
MHQPMRGDAVEAWIKAQRDCYTEGTESWHALDDLLDDYRLLSDQGEALPHISGHIYVSTACQHEHEKPELHKLCRDFCKWCESPCSCPRHDEKDLTLRP